MLFYNLVNRRPNSRGEPIGVWTFDLCWFDIWLHLLNLWLQQRCLSLQPWSPYWPLERLKLWALVTLPPISHSKRQFFFNIHPPFFLANGNKSKIKPSLFWCHFYHSSHTWQIHTKDLAHTLCKDKQTPQ